MFDIQLSNENFENLVTSTVSIVNSEYLHHNSSKYSPHNENKIGWKSPGKDHISCWLTMFSNRYPNIQIKKENI